MFILYRIPSKSTGQWYFIWIMTILLQWTRRRYWVWVTQGEYTLFRVTQEWIGQDVSLWVTLWMEPGTGVLYRAPAALTALRVSSNYKYILFLYQHSQRVNVTCFYAPIATAQMYYIGPSLKLIRKTYCYKKKIRIAHANMSPTN